MTSDKAAVIQRWDNIGAMYAGDGMFSSEDGDYVLYTDHATALDDMTSDRDSWQEQASDRVKDWDEMRRKAEAAERRVAELERAASNVIRKAQQKSKLTSSVFTNDLQRLEAALAPAKKVD